MAVLCSRLIMVYLLRL